MIRIAKTESGLVRGMPTADPFITVFRGVPFAAPPVGENRWRIPQPAEKWEGVRDCYTFGPIAMQDTPSGTGFYDKEWHNDPSAPMGEDCLQLNIWTPAKSAEDKLPIMVWIYGGGLNWGNPVEMEFDGERIASRGVILVSVNYRINVFGFLAHPELTAETGGIGCTNFGLYDQKAGIDWVHRNIADFGGDPENITIFGQSAGGRSTLCQLVTPLNANSGISHAISQSGGGMNFAVGGHAANYPALSQAEEAGERFFKRLGVTSLAQARELDAATVLKAGRDFRNNREGSWGFVIDGHFLPDQPLTMIAENRRLQIPTMIGSTSNEFFDVIRAESVADLADFEAKARGLYGEYADAFLALCDFASGDLEHILALCKVNGSDFGSRLFAMRAADAGLPAYLYCFDQEMPGDDAGAFHSSELWFTFETLGKCWRPFKGKSFDLARQVCNYWTNFAKTGDPNGLDADGTAMPNWALFANDSSSSIVFGDAPAMETTPLAPCIQGMYRLAADKLWRK